MLRTTTALALSLLAAGSAALWLQPSAEAAAQSTAANAAPSGLSGGGGLGLGFAGFQIAGTYYVKLTDDFSGQTTQALTTYRADGTVDGVDNDDLGLGLGSLDSAAHGTWRATAPGQFETVLHYFTYDASGVHTATVRVTVLGNSSTAIPAPGVPFNVTYVADIFLPFQNPAIDAPAVPGFAGGTGQSWRMP